MGAPQQFGKTVGSVEELRRVLPEPGALTIAREIGAVDRHCELIISRAPIVFIASSSADGHCDVSPRGGLPGFVRTIDQHHLLIPEMSGNRRADTMCNILENGRVGLLFAIPGWGEILRVNGEAWLVNDPEVLAPCAVDGMVPKLGVGVRVEAAFLHCAKAFMRSSIWLPDKWPEITDIPSLATMLHDHTAGKLGTKEELSSFVEESYRTKTHLTS